MGDVPSYLERGVQQDEPVLVGPPSDPHPVPRVPSYQPPPRSQEVWAEARSRQQPTLEKPLWQRVLGGCVLAVILVAGGLAKADEAGLFDRPSADHKPTGVSPGVLEAAAEAKREPDYSASGFRNPRVLERAFALRTETTLSAMNAYVSLASAKCAEDKLGAPMSSGAMGIAYVCTATMSDGLSYDYTAAVAKDGSSWELLG